MTNKKRVCIVVSNEMTIKTFLLEHLKLLCTEFELSVVANTNCEFLRNEYKLKVNTIKIPINRNINIYYDLVSFVRLYLLFKKHRFDLVHSVTPKAGLLSMLASFITKVPVRIHIFTGQVWVTKRGLIRTILKIADTIISNLATHILADSFSQRDFLVQEEIVGERKINVLAQGSICGVDISRFKPNPSKRKMIRNELNITDDDIIFLFIGRLKKDKGVIDLSIAFSKICKKYKNTHLIIVGPDEENLTSQIYSLFEFKSRIHMIKYSERPEHYMAASDVFCLPSYREGFGSVIIEAAACGLPAVATKIYGITDAVENNVTGIIVDVNDVDELASTMEKLYHSYDLRNKMGNNAMARAIEKFQAKFLTTAWKDFYHSII